MLLERVAHWFGLKNGCDEEEDRHVFTRDTHTGLHNQSSNLSGCRLSQESACGMGVMVNSVNLCQQSI